ncbi:MAG: DNA-binding transcriptional LysR family regulator [Planctomycetota bacterium]
MKFNLKQLEAFVWVSDLGSFRKAADRLNTTQPNISARIAALESILGVSLMARDAGSVRLTSKGQELLGYARNVLRASDDMIEVSNQGALLDGVLKLGVTEMVVHTWLREFLRVLKDRYANISVELTVDLSVNLERELYSRSIDLAFQSGPFTRETSGNRELGIYPMIWVASPDSELATGQSVSVENLVQYPILTHARGTQPYEEVAAHFNQFPGQPIRLVPSSNLAACIHMAIDGFGTAAVPAAMVVDELAAGELAQVNYHWAPKSLNFYCRYEAERAQGFVERVVDIASEVATGFSRDLASPSDH